MEKKDGAEKVNIITTAFHGALLLFAFLFIITLPFTFSFLPSMPATAFKCLYQFAGEHIFKLKRGFNATVESDSAGMYMHCLFLLLFSFLLTGLWITFRKQALFSRRIINLLTSFLAYYLAFQLLVYGFNKIFKWQFYLPEPNTLFTTVGNTWRDLMYWNTIGVSRGYNIFLGTAEVIVAAMLLFRRTRTAGAGGAAVLLLNIIAVNFAYDISVKLLSCFLLLLAVLIIWPQAKPVFNSFFRKNEEPASAAKKYVKLFAAIKITVILLIFCSALYPYLRSGNFNDDKAPRPKFHGAYDVSVFTRNGDTLPPLLTDTFRWRRVFIHRKNYFIIQKMNDEMYDYEFFSDTVTHQFISPEFILHYTEKGKGEITVSGVFKNDSLGMILQKIDTEKLPLLQNEFHWSGDE